MTVFIKIEEPARPAATPRGFALWQMGFRPFYLLASVFAALHSSSEFRSGSRGSRTLSRKAATPVSSSSSP